MLRQLTKVCFPQSDASSKDFRISGTIYMAFALPLAGVIFATLMTLGQMHLMSILLWPSVILWLMGTHRVLWGGATASSQWLSIGWVVVTAVVGFISLGVVSGLTGAVIGLIKRAA